MMELKNKKIAIIGLSRTGVATAEFLSRAGARVIVSDTKTAPFLEKEMEALKGLELDYELGYHGEKSLAADLIVVSPGVPLDIPFFKKAREKGIPIISEIELAYHFTEGKIIAITGTNGKTTTTSLIGEILQKAQIGKVKVAGNIGTPLIREIGDLGQDDWLVVEVSSFQLETIVDFKPDISLFLNFTADHLDRHKSLENYWLAKKRIFENQTSRDMALVNFDDQDVMKAVKDFPGRIYQVSMDKKVNPGISLVDNKLVFRAEDREEVLINCTDIPLPGLHNIQNVAFAALTAYLLGIPVEIIRNAIRDFKAAGHRLEEVCLLENNILVIDDSKATNPDAAIKGIESFTRPLVLLAGGQDRNADFTEWGRVVRERARVLVLLGETRYKMREVALKSGFPNINIHIADNMKEAVEIAAQNLKPGDCLLLSPACPSWDMYKSYQERGREFQDLVKTL
ncbi:MAG TPA: UDP-N-acetylmuramoyl-L-alanine--D-glutamate ligase [Halanaerobiaceae bacterium]|jgi:UDP-N-acetylmuramoylalanine--D-glutamate ligase|nr:UDP-N-acetylmuramoyl-L-alanine--D-glutamate ligase [Bacillota bacterium]HHU91612.1 UDP-N-acetylmuramoyl-L-alanine--D-glutamate ligase [Halanaerobiaceae bacterium]HOA40728.1 UDP-N-acetylmuramoyl-L-alanine--D-glutamate ligase [Halanaerobiales bacterium]HPZ62230.1 UDP-N-acetylmuramoyl-L-alanine--D-glutamate ligase [Halanaerobiales bacterium]HQD03614.1 UDP-N-acetylmuramoyl-L-alanine--D-glutamate ligase [Halanaerobiales bacterium]